MAPTNTTMTQYCNDCNTALETFPVCKDGETVDYELGCPNEGYCKDY